MKIISRDGSWAIVQSGNHQHRVNVDLVPDVAVGDFVIAHADLAIGIISSKEALEIEKISI